MQGELKHKCRRRTQLSAGSAYVEENAPLTKNNGIRDKGIREKGYGIKG
jgi:hypothetical protein